MRRLCRPAVLTLSLLYTLALVLLTLEILRMIEPAFSWANLMLVPLGLPWVLGEAVLPPSLSPWLVMTAPAANLLILRALCGRGRG